MSKLKQRRSRGVVLTSQGLEILQAARSDSENQHNFGERYTYEKISELTNLDLNTVKKIIIGKEGVDRRSLEQCFLAFNLQLTDKHYTKPRPKNRQDWGEAVAIEHFFGRSWELETLEKWILQENCRLISLQGMGGIGKTTLSIKLAEKIRDKFDCVIWKSLRDAPPVTEVLANLIEFISHGKETSANLPERVGDRITVLIHYLRSLRCLIFLDNAESLLDKGRRAGKYRPGYEGYGELLSRVGETRHLGCLIITTREKPKEIAILEGTKHAVRSLQLDGLRQEGQKIFQEKGLIGSDLELANLRDRYSGNPLALKVVATTIQDLFAGNIAEFLDQDMAVFGDIRDILDQQFQRLSQLEQEIMYWLAIAREPITLKQLQADFVLQVPSIKLLEALESLSRRSLIEKNASHFTQQPVVMEYTTSSLIEKVCEEIATKKPQLLRDHSLIKATAKDYIRENQIRLILQPVIDELLVIFRSKKDLEACLRNIIITMQETAPLEKWYVAGNILNLFCCLNSDLTNYDFSSLCIWQADLRKAKLYQVNFKNSDLSNSVFAENFGGIWSVAFSPDGKYLATGDTKGEILLRRVTDGQVIGSLKGHNSWIVSLEFSPNGNLLASGSCDNTAKLWDIKHSQCLYSLEDHEQEVWSVAFSPDGQTLATGCDDHHARLWNVQTGECLKVFQGHNAEVLAVTFSRDNQELITGSQDSIIRFWDIESGKCQKFFQAHKEGIRSLTVSPDGCTLASSSNDRSIKLWDIKTMECLKVFEGHSNVVFCVTFCAEGNFLASSGIDQTVRLWDIQTGECLKVFQGHSNMVNSVAFRPQGDLLASGSYDQLVQLWDIKNYQCFKKFQGYSNQALSVAFSPDGQTLASGGHDQKVRLWDIQTGKITQTLHDHSNWVFSVAFNSQGNLLVSGSVDKTVKLWDVTTGKAIKTFWGHEAVIRSVVFNSDNKTVVSGSEDGTIRLWDINTGQNLKTLRGHKAGIWSIAINYDLQILASASWDTTIKLWSISTGECIQTLSGDESLVWSASFHPDNKTLVSGRLGSMRFWNIKTGECTDILQGDNVGNTQLVAFSRDGKIIASCNQDHNIRLWNFNTKKCFKVLHGHKALVSSIAFHSEDQTLVSSSEDETIKIWNLKTGECIQTLVVENPYEFMNIKGITGLDKANINMLKSLGAVTS